MTRPVEPSRDELFRYLEGEVTESRAREIAGLAESNPELRKTLEQLRQMTEALRAPDPAHRDVDLVAAVREAALRVEPSAPRRARPWLAGAGAGALAAAAALLFVLAPGLATRTDEGFRVKAAAPHEPEAERWAGIRAFRLAPSGRPQPLGAQAAAGDSLLFAYTNAGPSPYSFLLVFGVDQAGTVFWYHPAWENAGEDPEAIAIRASAAPVELPEKISHSLKPGPLALYAVFAKGRLRVSDIESALRPLTTSPGWDAGAPPRLPLDGTAQHLISVSVAP